MPEMGLDKLEARLHDLKQDINDSVVAVCKRWRDTRYTINTISLERKCMLLNKMIGDVTDMNIVINRFLSLTKQGLEIMEAHKKLEEACSVVKDE